MAKNQAAVSLGKRGGTARARNLTSAERKESARRAAQARWSKTRELVDEINERSKALEVRASRVKTTKGK